MKKRTLEQKQIDQAIQNGQIHLDIRCELMGYSANCIGLYRGAGPSRPVEMIRDAILDENLKEEFIRYIAEVKKFEDLVATKVQLTRSISAGEFFIVKISDQEDIWRDVVNTRWSFIKGNTRSIRLVATLGQFATDIIKGTPEQQ